MKGRRDPASVTKAEIDTGEVIMTDVQSAVTEAGADMIKVIMTEVDMLAGIEGVKAERITATETRAKITTGTGVRAEIEDRVEIEDTVETGEIIETGEIVETGELVETGETVEIDITGTEETVETGIADIEVTVEGEIPSGENVTNVRSMGTRPTSALRRVFKNAYPFSVQEAGALCRPSWSITGEIWGKQ